MVYMCVRAGARRAGGWQKNGGARAKNEDFSCVYANFFVPLRTFVCKDLNIDLCPLLAVTAASIILIAN